MSGAVGGCPRSSWPRGKEGTWITADGPVVLVLGEQDGQVIDHRPRRPVSLFAVGQAPVGPLRLAGQLGPMVRDVVGGGGSSAGSLWSGWC